jgi:hypothetical protein
MTYEISVTLVVVFLAIRRQDFESRFSVLIRLEITELIVELQAALA